MDPWNWTVDEVVRNFCSSRELWRDRPNSSLPSSTVLEALLRENEVNGSTLLQDITKKTLRDDFGIKKIGERSALVHAVAILQAQSPRYISHRAKIEAREQSVRDAASTYSPAVTPNNEPLFQVNQHTPAKYPLPESQIQHRPDETLVEDIKGGPKRRKLLPNAVQLVSKSVVLEQNRDKYLMEGKMPLDRVFYGDIEDGTVLSTDEEDDFEFSQAQAQGNTLGHKRFIERRLRHYFQVDAVNLDEGRHAVYPYPERLVARGKGRSVTLIRSQDRTISATKRDAVTLDTNEFDAIDVNNNHDWDFLRGWIKHDGEEDILPAYGDSGSENAFSLDLINEIEEEQQERSVITGRLSHEDVVTTICEAVKAIESSWHATKEPKREQTAYRIWRKGQGRKGIVAKERMKHDLEHVNAVLSDLHKWICDEVWTKADKITKQCASLQLSVFNKLDMEWTLKLWQRRHAPPKPLRLAKPVKIAKVRVDPDEDAESLESESDQMEDFVEEEEEEEEDARMIDVSESPYISAREEPSEPSPLPSPKMRSRHESRSRSRSPSDVLSDSPRSSPLPDLTDLMSPLMNSLDNSIRDRLNTPDSQLDRRGSIIDLTGSSPIPSSPSPTQYLSYGDDPESATNDEIDSWDWDRLEFSMDRKRLIMKLYFEMKASQRSGIIRLIKKTPIPGLIFDVEAGLKALNLHLQHIPGRDNEGYLTTVSLGRLFACWFRAKRTYWDQETKLFELDSLLDEDAKEDIDRFLQFSKDLANSRALFDGVFTLKSDLRKSKKGKMLAPKIQQAQKLQENAHARQLEENDRAIQNIARLQSTFDFGDDDGQGIPVNIGKRDEDEFVFINRHIAPKLKPHQIDGIRFMWRELMNLDEGRQGCLLAHKMGLGKTLQTIALLATIADAGKSENANVVKLVPEPLRTPKTLILCPAALVDNWKKEFNHWLPEDNNIGTVIKLIDERDNLLKEAKKAKRVELIRGWWKTGGVLIMSYDLFRILIANTPRGKDKQVLLNPKEHARMKKYLLTDPTIVVADEAHKLKNPQSDLTKTVHHISTKSRLALTGSPLANNLEDYYHMINWIAGDYLGDIAAFRFQYQEPIEAGFYLGSSRAAQRKSLKKLQALMADIDPKVQRADISVLKGILKSKMEFVVTVPLTHVQKQLYIAYVQALKSQQLADVAQDKILDWLWFLHLLCCHPSLFIAKLTNRDVARSEKVKAAAGGLGDEGDGTSTPGGDNIESMLAAESISKAAIERHVKIFAEAMGDGGDLDDIALSHKASIVAKIAMQSKRVGDRVLLFSHHIPVLDYFGRLLQRLDPPIRTLRLDGRVSSTAKISRVEAFEKKNGYDLFLISTKAGGLGLNLPAANRVILVDFGFNPTWEEQAVGRAFRMGQQKPVFVYHLITGGTFEGSLRQRTIFKTQLSYRAVDKKNVVSAAEKSEMYLFEPQEFEQQDVTEFVGKDPKVLDFVLKSEVGKDIYALSTTETLSVESEDKLTEEEWMEVEQMKADDKLRRQDPKAWYLKRERDQIMEQTRLFQQAQTSHGGLNQVNAATQPVSQANLPQAAELTRGLPMAGGGKLSSNNAAYGHN